MSITSKLEWRYATRLFDETKKIDSNTLEQIEDSLVLTASSFGLQPWKFIIVENQDLKNELTPASFGQPQTNTCSHLVVFTALKTITTNYIDVFVNHIAETRGTTLDKLAAYKDMMKGFLLSDNFDTRAWAKNQCYIALGNLLTVCADLQIDTCAMEGIIQEQYNAILDVDSNYTTVVACAIGYRSANDAYAGAKKVRFHKEQVIVKK